MKAVVGPAAIKARERVEAYLAERAKMRGLDDQVHGLHAGHERQALLLVDDLAELCAAVATGFEMATLRERERIYAIVMRAPFEAENEGDSEELKNSLKAMAFDITMQIRGVKPPREPKPGEQEALEF